MSLLCPQSVSQREKGQHAVHTRDLPGMTVSDGQVVNSVVASGVLPQDVAFWLAPRWRGSRAAGAKNSPSVKKEEVLVARVVEACGGTAALLLTSKSYP